MGGVDPSFEVADANALESGRAFNQFVEGCWFYFGQAVSLGHPFLCTRDPDQELASLQASTTERFYQYGSFQLYSATAGNVSLWYAVDEAYDFSMIYNYYTCGVRVRVPASTVVRVAAAGVLVFPTAFRLLAHDALLSNYPSITITAVSMFRVRYLYWYMVSAKTTFFHYSCQLSTGNTYTFAVLVPPSSVTPFVVFLFAIQPDMSGKHAGTTIHRSKYSPGRHVRHYRVRPWALYSGSFYLSLSSELVITPGFRLITVDHTDKGTCRP